MIATLAQQLELSVQVLPGVILSVAAHQQAGQQQDNLCGPYWISLLLRSRTSSEIRADQIALLAGSILPIAAPMLSVPPGAQPRLDYQIALPTEADTALSGTSVPGLIAATTTASAGQYALVPLYATWTAERVETVLAVCQAHASWNAVPLCNIQTGHLWGTRLGIVEAISYLNGAEMQPPTADWDVGHFVVLAGQVIGTARSLLVIQDTYPIFGWNGYHLQPATALAQALSRTDGSQGGMLLFVAERDRVEVEQCLQAEEFAIPPCGQRFAIAPWDNGTPAANIKPD